MWIELMVVYPIRTTITDHSRNNPSALIDHQKHPGYWVSTPEYARQYPLETYTKGHELYAKHEELREDFARGMRQAKICVFDASLERKMIRKVRLGSFALIFTVHETKREKPPNAVLMTVRPSPFERMCHCCRSAD